MSSLISFFSRHMTALILFPCVLLAAIIIYDSAGAYNNMMRASQDKANAEVSNEILSLVHELQKERGYSAGFLGSKGANLRSELNQQRRATDNAFKVINTSDKLLQLDAKFEQSVQRMFNDLKQIKAHRMRIDSLDIELANALGYYTRINGIGINLVNDAAKRSDNPKVIENLFAIAALSHVKESAGIERAILTNVFAGDQFPNSLRRRHETLLLKQQIYFDEAIQLAAPGLQQEWLQMEQSGQFKRVAEIRNSVIEKDSGYGVTAKS